MSGYRVEFVQDPGFGEYETYFLVTRADGKLARQVIDVDADKCRNLAGKRLGR